jgi:hypothetical protein
VLALLAVAAALRRPFLSFALAARLVLSDVPSQLRCGFALSLNMSLASLVPISIYSPHTGARYLPTQPIHSHPQTPARGPARTRLRRGYSDCGAGFGAGCIAASGRPAPLQPFRPPSAVIPLAAAPRVACGRYGALAPKPGPTTSYHCRRSHCALALAHLHPSPRVALPLPAAFFSRLFRPSSPTQRAEKRPLHVPQPPKPRPYPPTTPFFFPHP